MEKRNNNNYVAYYCALTATLLLLSSVFLLYTRLSTDRQTLSHQNDDVPQLDDDDITTTLLSDEDILDFVGKQNNPSQISGYYFDHVSNVVRLAFNRRSIDDIEKWGDYTTPFLSDNDHEDDDDRSKAAFGSDDVPVDEGIRRKLVKVNGIEDALLLKLGSKIWPLREGWGDWFDKKSDFLRRDKMFRSNFDVLNPVNNPLLQDPDGFGVTGLTRGDKVMQKALIIDLVKDLGKKMDQEITQKVADSVVVNKSESSGFVYTGGGGGGGRRWGYFPGLERRLSFSNFMDVFFRKFKCSMRVFMVWNSPPWIYTVRHRRGVESVFFHHPDACVVVFSETIELDFFKEFLKDGFRIAVVMPNLEELLKDTPTSIFATVWHDWRTTRFYSTHYSELIRLAALYKYGGVYLDCDVVVLKPISSFRNSVGMEELAPQSALNGAVMAFSKNSMFVKQCMLEFFSSYDDTLLRWNGAELLTRVAGNLSTEAIDGDKEKMLKVQPASMFFPISSYHIQRYFIAPVTDSEKAHQDAMLGKILNESYTFHFWNSLTSALVPEPYSLVARILNNCCIYCLDLL